MTFDLTSSLCSLSTAKQAEAGDDPVLHGGAADAPEAALQRHGRHQAGDRGGQEEHELVRYDLSDAPQARSKPSNVHVTTLCRLAEDVDMRVVVFEHFGKNVPKTFSMSPDAFIQVALQLAYYR